jgi:hypothetical protein
MLNREPCIGDHLQNLGQAPGLMNGFDDEYLGNLHGNRRVLGQREGA